MKLILERYKVQPSRNCTLGMLYVPESRLILCTMELPWIPSPNPENRGGLKGKSCVPPGEYRLERHNTRSKPFTWALVNHALDVLHFEGDDHDPDEDRATCLFHVANYARELEGCIAPGLAHQVDEHGERWVSSSSRAMQRLRDAVPWTDDHTLSIEVVP